MPETMVGDVNVNYADVGKGEPALLLMPGWCSSRFVFLTLAAECSHHRRVLCIDWPGHGASATPVTDFGEELLVDTAMAVIEASGVQQVIPVSMAHAGWVAIELRRKLGAKVPKMILLEWLILDPPPPFLEILDQLQSPQQWQHARDVLFSIWTEAGQNPAVFSYVEYDMRPCTAEMWARAGREIAAAYARAGSPLRALASLSPPVEVLHIYAQPEDPAFLAAQQAFAAENPWFQVHKLRVANHFPTIGLACDIALLIEEFITGTARLNPF